MVQQPDFAHEDVPPRTDDAEESAADQYAERWDGVTDEIIERHAPLLAGLMR
ncbi:hypothetical protein ACNAW0_20780 [Micromonospora sp. SL1-18]|uniref:hypothetical protein n=1 Tax=Micromonospora sp. SL1-18 TaxID=3399128 RepID=UPI003A4DD908